MTDAPRSAGGSIPDGQKRASGKLLLISRLVGGFARGYRSKTAKLETALAVKSTVRVSLVGLERLFSSA